MQIENGSTVHRIWKTLPEADLVAVFQNAGDAERFCKACIDRMPDGTFLAAVCHYTGKMTCFHKPAPVMEDQR